MFCCNPEILLRKNGMKLKFYSNFKATPCKKLKGINHVIVPKILETEKKNVCKRIIGKATCDVRTHLLNLAMCIFRLAMWDRNFARFSAIM